MYKRATRLYEFLRFKNLWETHKMLEIMDLLSRNNTVFLRKIELLNQESDQSRIHILIKNETGRFSFSSVFNSLFDFFDQGRINVVIQVKFRILRYFKRMCLKRVESEIRKNIGNIEYYNIFEEYNVLPSFRVGEYHEKSVLSRRMFNNGKTFIVFPIVFTHSDSQVEAFVPEIGHRAGIIQQQWNNIRLYFFLVVSFDKLLLFFIQLLIGFDKYLFLRHFSLHF